MTPTQPECSLAPPVEPSGVSRARSWSESPTATPATKSPTGIAHEVWDILGRPQAVSVVAYDASRAGPLQSSATVRLASPVALTHLARHPGELGFVRAYVDGAIDIQGDLYTVIDLAFSSNLNRPGMVGGSLPWKRGWSHAYGTDTGAPHDEALHPG
jgi:hypothetical protein